MNAREALEARCIELCKQALSVDAVAVEETICALTQGLHAVCAAFLRIVRL